MVLRKGVKVVSQVWASFRKEAQPSAAQVGGPRAAVPGHSLWLMEKCPLKKKKSQAVTDRGFPNCQKC